MHLTDPIADMLTRIRNANIAKHDKVAIPFSKIKESIANILRNEGYISEYEIKEEGSIKDIVVTLKTVDGEQVIKGLKRISKPGRRVYSSVESLPKVLGGLGIAIVTTPKGVLTDKECRKQSVGGEVLCYIW
ncbi:MULTISPECIES: 30S ribosomal protein S8 [Streptobacillus]|uniref:Small ribosomal subunit protein uS8 n=1 Tax=Streptobacillus moniliformis (strain ATCC 14647 / DSM 12112 / NCTC 10651 / 9901) TaxID=519441 RepID=D1AVG4_STRM9|nr:MULTISPECIES: 30S ribosomal protein S8 [Streptobacillus]ACZ01724.1 ribosomal protein S8 [Streptobacillus moniliformis DSM 12112]AVL43283.1 30S ribosomal protein S8 [Streptobacillus moniliformis]SQA13094.1 30S ribosomal protein S8 [Streptobacillus moniliformis]SQA14679.1 30S ribosomal protein S8 [Streptobacillus moniliformis]SQA14682.1 30S ribosomal protein S8 [Streptobacillus moniliformis]